VSGASPEDLAVAFRSFPRRLQEALAAGEDDSDRAARARALVPTVTQAIDDAAGALGVPSGDAASVAQRIAAIPADKWDPGVLDRVRQAALDAGQAIRTIADL
jgi:hypothetical protein